MKRFFRLLGTSLVVMFLSLIVIGLSGFFAGWLTESTSIFSNLETEVAQGAIVMLILLAYFFSLIFFFSRRRDKGEVAELEADAYTLRQLAGSGSAPQAAAKANAAELRKNFAIIRSHARYAFMACLTAFAAGFASLLAAVWFYMSQNPSLPLATVSGIGSAIAEFIAAGFFVLYQNTNKDLRNVVDRLERLDSLANMLDEAENIRDLQKRDEVMRELILSILRPPGAVAQLTPPADG